jgi:hypothetical protein
VLTGTPKNSRPVSIIHTGMPDATRVTLIGVELCSARYCSALYMPMPSRPSMAYCFQWRHRPACGRNTGPASGSRISKCDQLQRRKLSKHRRQHIVHQTADNRVASPQQWRQGQQENGLGVRRMSFLSF